MLVWFRYSGFIILYAECSFRIAPLDSLNRYPVGVAGEMLCAYMTLPLLQKGREISRRSARGAYDVSRHVPSLRRIPANMPIVQRYSPLRLPCQLCELRGQGLQCCRGWGVVVMKGEGRRSGFVMEHCCFSIT